ncbi:hypothetical protein TGAM01_v200946 [Trichoderma gamsii]|uniref:Uncharacterized protein n=1 Tax=Trichoderma gamsii TaxID=398673 RepID=A0A2P5A1U2_9HYPO|nr:hypothetical protein TGAM01_v200946 [Trichoderma gamsii]PON30506.1 hypothetical protein TGAM01_v200946 [Trichoderma gamsii]
MRKQSEFDMREIFQQGKATPHRHSLFSTLRGPIQKHP